ncbi:MAG: linear amide C-N hydrolase [Francisellaceae bacterium]
MKKDTIIKSWLRLTLLSTGFTAATLSAGYSCTVVSHQFDQIGEFNARSLDFCHNLKSDFIVYPRGLDFHSADKTVNMKIFDWVNKYGYVTIAQSNLHDLSSEGLNEKGLSVHILYNGDSEEPELDKKTPVISSFQWIHYALGNFATVDEVLKSLKNYQIHTFPIVIGKQSVNLPIHFKIEDRSGDSAVLEFSHNQLKIYHGKQYNTMTNEPSYDQQIKNLEKYQHSKQYSVNDLPGGADPKNRLVRAYYAVEHLPKTAATDAIASSYMYSVINSASVPFFEGYNNCGFGDSTRAADTWPTQWVSVSNLNKPTLSYSGIFTGNRVWIDLSEVDLQKGQPMTRINLDNPDLSGNLSHKLKGK